MNAACTPTKSPALWLAGAGLVALTAATAAHADSASYVLGSDLGSSSGRYGTAIDTRINTFRVRGEVHIDDWDATLSVPWLSIDGNPGVVPGAGTTLNPKKRGKAGATTATASGLGDISLTLGHDLFYDAASRTGADLTGRLKLGTASQNEGLGTGTTDAGLLLAVYRRFGSLIGMADLGTTRQGSSSTLHLRPRVADASLTVVWRPNDHFSLSAALDAAEPTTVGGTATRSLSLAASRTLATSWTLQGSVGHGLTTASPDWSASLGLRRRFE